MNKKPVINVILITGFLVLFFGCKSAPEESGAAAPSSGPDAAYHLNRGYEYFNQYEFDLAIGEFSEALKKDPAMAEAYIARGNSYSGKLDMEKALDDYVAGAEIDAGYDFYARGYSSFRDKDYRSAVEWFSQAIAQKSNLHAACNDRGLAYASMGNLNRAIADYDEAIRMKPNSAFAYNNRGNAYLSKANYKKAIDDYSKAVDIYPGLVYAYSGRGFANYRAKEYDKAIADYTKAIAITPYDSSLYASRGDAYLARGEKALADADYAMAGNIKK